jgi:hypothetical protein
VLRLLALCASLFAPLTVAAQQSDEQLWSQVNVSTPVGDNVRLTLESIARFGNAADGLAHTEFGGQLSHKLSGAVEVAAGYRHVQDYDHGRAVPNEERLRQTVTVALGSGLSARLGFEQRFSSAGSGTGFRLRPRLGLRLPLGSDGLGLFATHEDFFNLNTAAWGPRRGHERMRHTLGLSIPLAKGIRSDWGYLHEYRFGRGRSRDQMTHAATLALNLEL